jgi:hypothetical protein
MLAYASWAAEKRAAGSAGNLENDMEMSLRR